MLVTFMAGTVCEEEEAAAAGALPRRETDAVVVGGECCVVDFGLSVARVLNVAVAFSITVVAVEANKTY